ncbi:hypothetical protein BY996DRAFT_6421342 [Phakopsora pachyrhizi]|nr:hypothetical protein BY996DRAFT_6421342 [Phakopsora pachyrhizi]
MFGSHKKSNTKGLGRNDFVPHLPGLHINKGALGILYGIYKNILPEAGGYLNKSVKLNTRRLQLIMNGLVQLEHNSFKHQLADLQWFDSKQLNKVQRANEKISSYRRSFLSSQQASMLNKIYCWKTPVADDLHKFLADKLDNFTMANHSHYIALRRLINNGNLCFANAILQALVHWPPLYKILSSMGQAISPNLADETYLLDAMVAFGQEFRVIENSNSPTPGMNNCSLTLQNGTLVVLTDKPFIAESVWAATKGDSQFHAMRCGQQEDSQEFLCFFLETLHKEILYAIKKHDHLVQLKHQEISTTAVKKLDLKQQFDKPQEGVIG